MRLLKDQSNGNVEEGTSGINSKTKDLSLLINRKERLNSLGEFFFRKRTKSNSSIHSIRSEYLNNTKENESTKLRNIYSHEIGSPHLVYWQKMKDRCQSVCTIFEENFTSV